MTEIKKPIPTRIYNSAQGGHVCGPEDIDFGQKVVHLIKYDHQGNEVTFEEQVDVNEGGTANTIYVIHDDFTLTADVTIPENCTLQFDGGSINGACTLTGQNTGIQAGIARVFTTDITLDGDWNVAEAYPEWFGAAPSVDSSDAIKNCILAFPKTVFCQYGYVVEKQISLGSIYGKEICAHLMPRSISDSQYTLIAKSGFSGDCLIYVAGGSGLKFQNLKIKGAGKADNLASGLACGNGTWSITFDHCTFDWCNKGLSLGQCWNITFLHCIFNQDYTAVYNSGTMTSSTFIDCISYDCHIGEHFNGGTIYTSIVNTGHDRADIGLLIEAPVNITLDNCGWEEYYTAAIYMDNDNAKVTVIGGHVERQQEGANFITGSKGTINVYDFAFPDGITINRNVNYINCTNIPYYANSEGSSSDFRGYTNRFESKNAGRSFVQHGSARFAANTTIYYEIEASSSIKNNDFLCLDLTVMSQNTFYNGKLIANNNDYNQGVISLTNPDYTDLLSVSKSGTTLSVTFLTDCRVIVDGIGRGVKYLGVL